MSDEKIEKLSAKLHDIYIQEAKRQGDVRHKELFADLPENIKEYDRALARYIQSIIDSHAAEIKRLKTYLINHFIHTCPDGYCANRENKNCCTRCATEWVDKILKGEK